MRWLIAIVTVATVAFYLRFLWAMNKELNYLRKHHTTCRSWQPVVRRNLFRLDPADLWTAESDADGSRSRNHL
jgi:hypothetical protein